MNTPYFSIVIPAFNRADSISETLQSVLNQTNSSWECIVVDDGSKDGAELESLIARYQDRRIRYIRQENAGGGAARNTGIAHAQGEFIAFLDSDDLFIKSKLETLATIVNPDLRAVYYSPVYVRRAANAYWIRPDRLILPGESVGDYLFVKNQFIQTSSIVLHRRLANEVMFDPDLRKGQDLDLCIRLEHAGIKFVPIPEPLSIWVDETEENRTSRHQGAEAPIRWLESHRHKLSSQAFYGYRANVLAYYVSKQQPLTALMYLLDGLFKGGVPAKVIARQFLRCFIPRRIYRRIVDRYVQRHSHKKSIKQ